jgi:hypothetical protein
MRMTVPRTVLWTLVAGVLLVFQGTAAAQETAELTDHYPAVEDDCGCCLNDVQWSYSLTQAVGFGTGLALPLTLTPANTTVFGDFQDDFEFLTIASVRRQVTLDADTTFTTGLGYYQNLHPQLEQLDLQAPSASAQLARKLSDRTVAALDYSYSYYFLSGSTFVTQHRVDLSLLSRLNDQWDWKVSGGYADANFQISPLVNSDNYSARAELIRYLNDDRTSYLTGGYAYGRSNAVLDAFGYDVNSVFAGFQTKLDELHTLSMISSYGNYQFRGVDPFEPGSVVREDDLFSSNVTLSRSLSEAWTLFGSYSYLNSDSNVTRQGYHTNLALLGVTFSR